MRKFEEWGKERRDWKMKKRDEKDSSGGDCGCNDIGTVPCGLGGRERTGG